MAADAAYTEARAAVKREYVGALEQGLKELQWWAEQGWQGESLETLEREIQDRALEVGRRALECRLSEGSCGSNSTDGASREQRCPCGESARLHSYRRRQVETLVGTVGYQRAYYWCRACGKGGCAMDRSLHVERGQYSPGLKRVITYAGAQLPFGQAADSIYESSGRRFQVGVETVRRLSEQLGGEAMVRWEVERRQLERDGVDPSAGTFGASVEAAPARLVIEAAGTMVPTQEGWKEAKVSSVVSWNEPGKVERKVVFARLDNPERFGNRLWLEAQRAGVEATKAVAVLGDVTRTLRGAHWIWNQYELIAPQAEQILDFWHVKDHLYKLAYAHYGPGAERATAWVHAREGELLSAHPEQVRLSVQRLRPTREAPKVKRTDLLRYLLNNHARIHYRRYQNDGWPIGSGDVEGAGRSFVGDRMKKGGAKWVKDNAQFILDLRSLIVSNRWDHFWKQRFSPN